MRIERLTASNVRNLLDVTLEPAPQLNLFLGINASGKTALLEAVYLLARGRSFRTPRIADVVRHETDRLQVSARITHGSGAPVAAGIERGPGHLVLRYNGEAVNAVSAHARRFPLVVLTPDSQQLVLGGPAVRRDWLDWAMFHVEPRYLEHWRDYHRALRQRNRLLKDGSATAEMIGWEEIMARSGTALDQARQQFLEQLKWAFSRQAAEAWSDIPELHLRSGWDAGRPLAEQLAGSRTEDLACGFTRRGPHRADVDFIHKNNDLASVFSRGESKLFICLLMLAEASVLAAVLGEPPVLLVDDFGAELDPGTQARLLGMLAGTGAQAFLTTTAPALCGALPGGSAKFHVERGRFSEMVE
jgi:DNA replication and repair protein RecF